MMRRALLPLSLLAVLSPIPASAQLADHVPAAAAEQIFPLSIRSIMRAQALVGEAPAGIAWTDDSRWIYFRWRAGGGEWDDGREFFRVPATGGAPERVSDEQADSVALFMAGGDRSVDGRWKLTTRAGDLYLVERASSSVRRLTDTRANEAAARFTADESAVMYQEGGNLFTMSLGDGSIRQITDIRSGEPPSDPPEASGHKAFLEAQQEELFEHIRREKANQEEARARREAQTDDGLEPVFVPQAERVGQLQPSPDGSQVLLSTFTQARAAQQTMVPDWVTASGYTEELNVRTKVGDQQGSGRVGFLTTASGEVTWLSPKPEGYEGDVRANAVGWSDTGAHVLLSVRSDNDQDRWLYALDATTGELTLLDHLYDEAWIGGPCGFGCQGWLPGTERAYFVSEETGFAHLYTIEADGSGRRALTSGEWEVLGAQILDGQDRFLMTTNEGSPFNQHVGWLAFDGGDIDYLTEGEGRYHVTVSPNGEHLAVVHDVANRPPELFVATASSPGDLQPVTVSPTPEWLSFPWIKPEILRFEAEDGTMVPARIYRPADLGAEATGAAVIFVHGAGYLHNVHNYWSSYYREYMFNHLLAASGYTVLDIDYRGSAGYGRDWRTAIYRWMGGKDLSDQVDGARYLVAEEGVDADRIGLYGGSYGGFITLMGLFTAGDTFRSGAALRSVTDWAHYNDGYTSNILNDPQEDEEAYERSSPIYFAENMRPDQHLLILHGMVDTNVHFSDVVRLAQRLIELGKENWEFAVYPVESHGFQEPSSWTDEYRRIFELFERTLSAPGG